jgi:hypothetical protein
MAKTPIDLYLLIIAPNSKMLLEEASKELPMIENTDKNAVVFPIDKSDLESKLRIKFNSYKGLKDLDFDYSRFKICDSASPATISSTKCVILIVREEEKKKIELDSTFKFYSTYENDPKNANKRKINSKLTLGTKSTNFFINFQYDTNKSGNPLDKCINIAPKPYPVTNDDTEVIRYRFYRPIFPLMSLFRPGIIYRPGIYPYINSPYVISPFTTPIGSPVRSPVESPMSPRFSGLKVSSPVVPRSPSSSPGGSPRAPVVPRMRRGGFYDKYMKYKLKYLQLKAENF